MKKRERRRRDVILLRDLAPRQEVKGGAGNRVFGESVEVAEQPELPAKRKRKRQRGSKR